MMPRPEARAKVKSSASGDHWGVLKRMGDLEKD
jgi:hypothetical protein